MTKIKEFLNAFIEAERIAIAARQTTELDEYNSKLQLMNTFLIDSLKNRFGMIPMTKLFDKDYYERVKDYPAPTKRHVYRIDEYKTNKNSTLHLCFVSEKTPDDWKEYHTLLIIQNHENNLTITSKFSYSDDETDNTKRWYFGGGEKEYMNILKGKYLLNKNALGELVKVNRFLEPSQDEDSMVMYNRDEL